VTCAAVVPAAGRGERLGTREAKALCLVGGVPLFVHALRSLGASGRLSAGMVVGPPQRCEAMAAAVRAARLDVGWDVVPGGATRQDSVGRGLRDLASDVDVVLVHDAARPFVPVEVVRRVVDAVGAGADAVVPVVPVADTVKQVDGAVVVATPDRSRLRQVQTPQGFRRSVLEAAYTAAAASGAPGQPASDDATLVERAGGQVVVVPGDPLAFKVTGPLDLVLAEALARQHG